MKYESNDLSKPNEAKWNIMKRMNSVARLKAAFGLFDFAREHLQVNLRAKHPDWTEEQIQGAVRERLMSIR